MLHCSVGPAASDQSVLGLKSQALGNFQWNLDRGMGDCPCLRLCKERTPRGMAVTSSVSAAMLMPVLSLCSLQAQPAAERPIHVRSL